MFNKLYEQIKKYIKNKSKFLIILVIILLISIIKLPYYIDIPGGTINISDRITIDNKKLNKAFNYAYVSELRATLPTYLYAKINKNWDIIKYNEIVNDNETEKEVEFRDSLSLKEAMSNAIYSGFKAAGKKAEIKNIKIYVTAISPQAKTNLKIGDQIIKINDKEIKEKKDLEYVNKMKEGTNINITVINNNKEYSRTSTLINMDDKTLIGVSIGTTFDVKTENQIKINYKAKESGPSGGLMTSLAIYESLTHDDIIKKRKIVGTGTIDISGNVGPIGGVKYKLIGAVKNKADIFIVPKGDNYEEAIKIKENKKYNIKIIGVSTLSEAINELEKS